MSFAWRCFVVTAALLAATELTAQTVYKSVDEKGNVTYSESPPKAKDGKMRSTKELSIDPNQNVMPAQGPSPYRAPASGQTAAGGNDGPSRQERVAAAQAALDAAEAQLKTGSQAQPGDFIGRASGGVGPSSQRLQRLDELQRAVDEARTNLEKSQSE